METRLSDTRIEVQRRKIKVRGLTPILFDRYPGDNDTRLEWFQKIYTLPGRKELLLPCINIVSFLSAHNTNSAPKRLLDARKFKSVANACLSFTQIESYWAQHPDHIPFLRRGKVILTGSFSGVEDKKSGLKMHRGVARLEKGIPNPQERAILGLPWELVFRLTIIPNDEIKEDQILNLFVKGGLAIGFGSFRGVYGKFEVITWEED